MQLTEAEALAIAESFAETLAVLHSEMALALRTMRGAGKPVDPRTCPACLAKKARGGK
jgi:hypothetical protein